MNPSCVVQYCTVHSAPSQQDTYRTVLDKVTSLTVDQLLAVTFFPFPRGLVGTNCHYYCFILSKKKPPQKNAPGLLEINKQLPKIRDLLLGSEKLLPLLPWRPGSIRQYEHCKAKKVLLVAPDHDKLESFFLLLIVQYSLQLAY